MAYFIVTSHAQAQVALQIYQRPLFLIRVLMMIILPKIELPT